MLHAPINVEFLQRISISWYLPLSLLVGVAYIALLPFVSQDFYVDENAFIVHSVQTSATPIDIRQDLSLKSPRNSSAEALQSWFMESFNTPSITVRTFEKDLVYSILRSRRSNGEDSIALVVPYYEPKPGHISGLHVAVALIKFLRNVKWLAKDVILICIPHDRPELIKTWIDAYHSTYLNPFKAKDLPLARAGALRCAFILDLPPAASFKAITISSGNSQGVLANFDVVAIVQYMLQQHNIPLTIADLYSSDLLQRSTSFLPWLNTWRPMFRFLADSISGMHSGLHGPFIDYNIDAVSLTATEVSTEGTVMTSSFISLVHASEEMIRAFSNLIEKLHHSVFLYILTSSTTLTTFVSFYWSLLIIGSSWPLCTLQRLPTILPASPLAPAWQTFSLVLMASSCLYYVPVLLGASSLLLILSSWIVIITISFAVYSVLPKGPSWVWLQAFLSCSSFIVILPFSIVHYASTFCCIFATVPLVLVQPSNQRSGHVRNILLLMFCSPILPLLSASIVFDLSVSNLVYAFLTRIATSDNLIYPLVFLLYLPNYVVAAIGAMSTPSIHVKTD
uniref:GPI transamidase component GAA1 n=1 Tax=Spongospora subterranea TaxID=70186 RepID=A0A0H5R9W0_9EUKA|eukprot:CRZ10467.1 hypothetical protein [Spongospora subterranea]